MLRKFLRNRAHTAAAPTVPAGLRVYAIGDVHGRLDLVDRLMTMIDADDAQRGATRTMLVFLGDLVDRGPDSAGVVERVRRLALERSDVHVLMGNHEEVFLAAIDGDPKALRLFCRIGGRDTALSYGISPSTYESLDYAELGAALVQAVPAAHRTFLMEGRDIEIIGDYAFVHAGVRPDRPLEDQHGSDLRWIRESFLDHDGPLTKMVVHGHTISDTVDVRSHRIGIDTGAYATGRLTALGLQDDQRWTLETR